MGTDLNDDVLTEILLRLPPKTVFRCRAVCKHWRLATTGASFVAAYSRRRPLDLILYRGRHQGYRQRAIDTVRLDGADGCRRLLDHGCHLKYFGSCDGLLLFSVHSAGFAICNPATRQCARFPALTPTPCKWVAPTGFYLHRPSGERRVLCFAKETIPGEYYDWTDRSYAYYNKFSTDDDPWGTGDAALDAYEGATRWPPVHYVFSTGAAQPRRLGPLAKYLGDVSPPPGVDVGGTLHWPRHPLIARNSATMVAFDTVSETFRQMPLPPAAATVSDNLINLFDMRGTLAASVMGDWPYMDVWALDDYGGERWSCRFRVELLAAATVPDGVKYGAAVAALEGDVLVLFATGGWVTLYDVKEKRTVRVVRRGDNDGSARWCVYREGLAPAVIDGLSCSSGVLPFDDRMKAEFCAIHYSLAET